MLPSLLLNACLAAASLLLAPSGATGAETTDPGEWVAAPVAASSAASSGAMPIQIGLQDQGTPQAKPDAQDGSGDKPQTKRPSPADIPGLPIKKTQPILAVDGQAVAPGRIPAGTSKDAVALWNQMLAANKSAQSEGPIQPIQSFDMTFEARFRAAPDKPESDVGVRFLFMEKGKGYLKAVLESGRQTLRGPDGDWMFHDKTWTQIQGREDRESVRELDRWVAISRNFVALTQARGIRLIELRALQPKSDPNQALRIDFEGEANLAGRFVILPERKLKATAQNLRWIEVTSPDFGLYDSGEVASSASAGVTQGAKVFRGALGLDPQGRVVLAQFHELRGGQSFPQGALFVHIPKWTERPSGYVLPRQLLTYRQSGPTSFEPHPNMDLWLKANFSRINPVQLTAANFQRPTATTREAR